MEAVKAGPETLLGIMEQELQLVCDLIGFAQEKERLLARSDTEGLNALLEQEEEIVLTLREEEKKRKICTAALADAAGISDEQLTLVKLTQRMDDPECIRRLVSAGNEMVQMMQKLSRYNGKVKKLLNHQVRYTEFMLNLLYRSHNKTPFYNMQGNREDPDHFVSRLDYEA